MKTAIPPRDRLYRAYWQEGSIDLFAGGALLLIGVGWLLDQVALAAVVPALAVPLWMAFRSRWITPRLGYVKFDRPREQQMRSGNLALIGLGIAAFAVAIGAYVSIGNSDLWRAGMTRLSAGIPTMLIGVGGIAAGFLFQLHRLALYGLACLFIGVGGAVLGMHPSWLILLGGGVPTIAGAVLLRRFLQAYPPRPTEPE